MSFIYRSYAQAAADVREWSRRLPADLRAVCGIPRSGTIIAAMLAEWRGIHLVEYTDLVRGARPWETPHRRHIPARSTGAVLVVDDTSWTGVTLAETRRQLAHLPTPIQYAALYAGDQAIRQLDHYGRRFRHPHSFEWNIGQDSPTCRACLDLDGVLCDDYPHAHEEGPEWEPVYRRFLAEARPLRLPGFAVAAIVTARLEKWRPETEDWLRRHGVRYGALLMHPGGSVAERAAYEPGLYKADHYARRPDATHFIESSQAQAVTIHARTQRPVFSVERMELLGGAEPDPFPPLRVTSVARPVASAAPLAASPSTDCRHRGPETRRIKCVPCDGKTSYKAYACALHGECLLTDSVQGVRSCSGCPDRAASGEQPAASAAMNQPGSSPAPMVTDQRPTTNDQSPARVVVDLDAPGHWAGLGDAVTLAWIAAVPENRVTLATGCGRKQALLTCLGIPWTTDKAGGRSVSTAYARELRDRATSPRLSYALDLLGRTRATRPTPAIPAEASGWASERAKEIGADRPFVLLFPQTKFTSREWPAACWVDLAWQLRDRGIPHAMMLESDDDRYQNTPLRWWGVTLDAVAALVARAGVVVGNDSMPAHLAGTLGRPTLALLGPTKPAVFAHVPEVEGLSVTRETLACVGCHFGSPFRAACDQGCQALYLLRPDQVRDRILARLQEGR